MYVLLTRVLVLVLVQRFMGWMCCFGLGFLLTVLVRVVRPAARTPKHEKTLRRRAVHGGCRVIRMPVKLQPCPAIRGPDKPSLVATPMSADGAGVYPGQVLLLTRPLHSMFHC